MAVNFIFMDLKSPCHSSVGIRMEEKQMLMFSSSSLSGSPLYESLNILVCSEISLDQVKLGR